VCDHIQNICQLNPVQTDCANFTKFTALVQLGTKMNWSYFEVRSLGSRSQWDQIWSKKVLWEFWRSCI